MYNPVNVAAAHSHVLVESRGVVMVFRADTRAIRNEATISRGDEVALALHVMRYVP
jgi:hypothetical protein